MSEPERSALPSVASDARYRRAVELARRGPGSDERRKAVDELRTLLTSGQPFEDADRAWFMLGSFLDDDGEHTAEAIAAYRKGLDLNPFFAASHNNLGVLLMDTGQLIPAAGAFKIAIQLEPDYALAYRNLACLIFDRLRPRQMEQEIASLIDEFGSRAPNVLSRLSLELIDLGRTQVYNSLYSRGHQLKNLLGLSGSRLRRAVRELPEDAPCLGDLKAVCEDQARIYDEWVDYLRTMKQDTLNPVLVDLADLASQVVDSLKARAGERRMSVKAEGRVPEVKADASMVREVVVNLVMNAVEATDEKGTVTVQVGRDAGRGTVFVEVEDDGPGIPAADQARVFDPGYSTKTSGNGYGLSICSRIVAAHQGTLRVISREGEGTVFRLDLPVDIHPETDESTVGHQGGGRRASTASSEEFVDP